MELYAKIQAIEHSSMKVYDLYFADGKLQRIRCWQYNSGKEIFDGWTNVQSLMNVVPLKPWQIEETLSVIVQDEEFDKFDKLLEEMRNDEIYLDMVKLKMLQQIRQMTSRIASMNEALIKQLK